MTGAITTVILAQQFISEMMYSETTLESTLNQVPPSKITTLMILIFYHLRQTRTQLTTGKMKLIFLICIPTRTVHLGVATMQCSKYFVSKKSLQNHTRFYHISPDYISTTRYLNGVCVDHDRGIYMIRRSFNGTSHPVHVMHNFGINGGFSCELNDCRELSNTTKRSGNPNFICNHLKSVQYVSKSSSSHYILPREPLEELLRQKVAWFKQKREDECLKLQENAVQDRAPVIAEFSDSLLSSTRYRHFSVYDGEVHHYSRFKRVLVTYDTSQNKWGCSCCRTKVNCVHKCIAKWFMYVTRPEDLL